MKKLIFFSTLIVLNLSCYNNKTKNIKVNLFGYINYITENEKKILKDKIINIYSLAFINKSDLKDKFRKIENAPKSWYHYFTSFFYSEYKLKDLSKIHKPQIPNNPSKVNDNNNKNIELLRKEINDDRQKLYKKLNCTEKEISFKIKYTIDHFLLNKYYNEWCNKHDKVNIVLKIYSLLNKDVPKQPNIQVDLKNINKILYKNYKNNIPNMELNNIEKALNSKNFLQKKSYYGNSSFPTLDYIRNFFKIIRTQKDDLRELFFLSTFKYDDCIFERIFFKIQSEVYKILKNHFKDFDKNHLYGSLYFVYEQFDSFKLNLKDFKDILKKNIEKFYNDNHKMTFFKKKSRTIDISKFLVNFSDFFENKEVNSFLDDLFKYMTCIVLHKYELAYKEDLPKTNKLTLYPVNVWYDIDKDHSKILREHKNFSSMQLLKLLKKGEYEFKQITDLSFISKNNEFMLATELGTSTIKICPKKKLKISKIVERKRRIMK